MLEVFNDFSGTANNRDSTYTQESTTEDSFKYIVQKGDTLSQIAQRYDTTTQLISNINHLQDSNHIIAGSALQIPKRKRINSPLSGRLDTKNKLSGIRGLPEKGRGISEETPQTVVIQYERPGIINDQGERVKHYRDSISRIERNVKELNSAYQEQTGIIGKTQDWIGEKTNGWGSARKIYEEGISKRAEEAKKIYTLIQNDAYIIGSIEANALIKRLNIILPSLRLQPVSIKDALTTSSTIALHTVNGLVEGTYESIKSVVTGSIDLVEGAIRFGIDPRYRTIVGQQMSQVWNYIQNTHYSTVGTTIYDAIKKEVYTINSLPEIERGFAIGQMGGRIIGLLTSYKAGVTVVGKISEMGNKFSQTQRITEKMIQRGLGSSEKIERAQRKITHSKYALMGINTILNGVAETALGAVVFKSYSALKIALASSITTGEKLGYAIKVSQDITSELQKDISNTTRQALEDLQERLESIKNKIRSIMGNGNKTEGNNAQKKELLHDQRSQEPNKISTMTTEIGKKVEEIMNILGAGTEQIRSQLVKMSNIIQEGVERNRIRLYDLINNIIQDIEINGNISLKIKASIIQKLKELRQIIGGYSDPSKVDWNIKTRGINIPHNGGIKGLREGTYLARKEGNGSYTIIWKDGHNEININCSENDFKKVNPHLYKTKNAITPSQKRQESSKYESFNENIANQLSSDGEKMYQDIRLPKPKYTKTIEGKEFLFTEVMNLDNKTVLGYTKVNGKYEPRYFYFSNSGGNWHCAPGVNRNGNHISKGEYWNSKGYTKETVVVDELQEVLGSLPISKKAHEIDFGHIWHEHMGNIVEHLDSVKLRDFKDRKRFTVGEGDGTIRKPGDLTSIDGNLSLEFNGGFKKGINGVHRYLGITETMIGTTQYNGRPVEIIFAWAKNRPDLIWIENIREPLVIRGIDSFGISNTMFNGGGLTAKPIDYIDNISKDLQKRCQRIDDAYLDIRELLQVNPLIIKFKQMQSKFMKKAA